MLLVIAVAPATVEFIFYFFFSFIHSLSLSTIPKVFESRFVAEIALFWGGLIEFIKSFKGAIRFRARMMCDHLTDSET